MSRPSDKEFISQYNSGLISMETLLQLIENDLEEMIYAETIKVISSSNKNKIFCPCCGALLARGAMDCIWCDWEDKNND